MVRCSRRGPSLPNASSRRPAPKCDNRRVMPRKSPTHGGRRNPLSLFAEAARARAERTPRSRRACGRVHSMSSSARSTSSAKGELLRRAIEADQLPSMVFWGPPGSGKTTLARIIASMTSSHFEPVSAVASGVADLRRVVAEASGPAGRAGAAHDPVHRRDPPLQQGAAGRRPALRRGRHDHAHRRDDREPLVRGDLAAALALPRLQARAAYPGAGRRHPATRTGRRGARPRRAARPKSMTRRSPALAAVVGGDARIALNALELAAQTATRTATASVTWRRRRSRRRSSTAPCCTTSAGDWHYDIVSAFIKSLRGLRSRRRALLARPHARGRRGPALRGAAAGDPGVGGRRSRRSAGAPGRGGGAAGRPLHRHARGVLPARRGDDLPGDGAEVEQRRIEAYGRAVQDAQRTRRRAGAAAPAQRADAADAQDGPRPRATSTTTPSPEHYSGQEHLPEKLARPAVLQCRASWATRSSIREWMERLRGHRLSEQPASANRPSARATA